MRAEASVCSRSRSLEANRVVNASRKAGLVGRGLAQAQQSEEVLPVAFPGQIGHLVEPGVAAAHFVDQRAGQFAQIGVVGIEAGEIDILRVCGQSRGEPGVGFGEHLLQRTFVVVDVVEQDGHGHQRHREAGCSVSYGDVIRVDVGQVVGLVDARDGERPQKTDGQ